MPKSSRSRIQPAVLRGSVEDMFWSRVERPASDDECWIWVGSRNLEGYGRIQVQGVHHVAHRLAYTLFVGPIPDGLVLDHACRTRHCVNPRHLEPVTDRVNILRGAGLAAQNSRKAFCPKGHPYDALWTRGYRHCRKCKRASTVAWERRNPEKAREVHRRSDARRAARKRAQRETEAVSA